MNGEHIPLLRDRHPVQNLDLDRLLEDKLGEFGRYQQFLYLLVCLPAILSGTVTMASVFTVYSPSHRCFIPDCDNSSAPSYEAAFSRAFANFTIPTTSTGTWDSCTRYQEVLPHSCSEESFSENITSCGEYVYSTDVMTSTLVTKLDIVCDDLWKIPLVQSVFFSGVLVGAAFYGLVGDLVGRKKAFLLGLVQTLVFGISCAFAPSYQVFVVLHFFTAMGQVGLFQTSFVLGIEFVGRSKREFCGIVIEFFFVLGEALLALAAWALRDWKYIQLTVVAPGILFLSFYFILPQSIRWLILKEKFSQAQDEINRVAKWNNVAIPSQQELEEYKQEDAHVVETVNENFRDLLKRPKLVLRLLIVFFSWIVVSMIYYGLSMNASNLVGDIFLNFGLLSIFEIPGYALSYVGMTYCGRKKTMVASMLLAGVSCLISGLLNPAVTAQSVLQIIFSIVGKLSVSCSFGTIYLYTAELFPTNVRNGCVGFSSMFGRIGSILSPYIVDLGALTGQTWLPMLIFAVCAVLSGLSNFLLPETKDMNLPRTMDEAENMTHRHYAPVNTAEDEEEE